MSKPEERPVQLEVQLEEVKRLRELCKGHPLMEPDLDTQIEELREAIRKRDEKENGNNGEDA